MGKIVTVKEFAGLAGVSEQSVYKRLTTSLKPYSTIVDNRKMVDISALAEVYGKDVMQPLNNFDSTASINVERTTKADLQVDILQKQIEDLKEDKARLYEELETKNQQITDLSETVKNITGQLENSQSQLLREQELLYLQMGGTEIPPTETPGGAEAVIVEDPPAEEPPAEPKKKRGLFSRFRR